MNLIPHRNRVQRSTFNKLPRGAPYWLATNTGVRASLKWKGNFRIDGWTIPGGAPILVQEATNQVAVIRVPELFTSQNEVSE